LYTLLILVIFRFGIAVQVPFVDISVMQSLVDQNSADMLSFMDFMTGGALSNGSLFALGVQPYINSSIIMQLLAVAIPALERMRKEGPEGQRKFNRVSRYVGAALAAVLGIGYYFIVRNQGGLKYGADFSLGVQVFTAFVITMCFVAGACLLMWMGEQIDQKGIGNGISIIIFAGIVSRWSNIINTVRYYWQLAQTDASIYVWVPVIFVLAAAAMVMVIILNAAERRIKVQYGKKVVGRKMYGIQSSHIPIKVNMSGVMPIIFASALTSIPATILNFFTIDEAKNPVWYSILSALSTRGWLYALIYAVLIIAFNYFYVAITYNPLEMANNLKKNNGSIPGIRPGKPTSDYISRVISNVTLIGALFLVVVACGPILLGNMSGLNIQLGGTSLLIVVGVALDTTRSLESFMLMRHHKGFM
jgi:preprotein translocase subunit SecY